MSEILHYYMVGATPTKPSLSLWVNWGTDRESAINDARKIIRLKPVIDMIVEGEITSKLIQTTRAGLDGEHPAGEWFGGIEVDLTEKPQPEDGKPRYYGVAYVPNKFDGDKEWKWMWSPPQLSPEAMMEHLPSVRALLVPLASGGLQVRICKTTRTDMEGWQVAGKPEDGEWVEVPETPGAAKVYYYPVVKGRSSGDWCWGPARIFDNEEHVKRVMNEFNAHINDPDYKVIVYRSDRADLAGYHPEGETFNAVPIQ